MNVSPSVIANHNKRLGGFHFIGSMNDGDDLTIGVTKPFQLFLILSELVSGMQDTSVHNPNIA